VPALRIYNLFISHSWKYDNEYNRIINFLDKAKRFKYKNYSSPKNNPVVPSITVIRDCTITKRIERRIKPASCVLVIGSMHAAYSPWIKDESGLQKVMINLSSSLDPERDKKCRRFFKLIILRKSVG